jgi:hypothetical protein
VVLFTCRILEAFRFACPLSSSIQRIVSIATTNFPPRSIYAIRSSQRHLPRRRLQSSEQLNENSDPESNLEDLPVILFNGRISSYSEYETDPELDVVETAEYPKVAGRLAKEVRKKLRVEYLSRSWND